MALIQKKKDGNYYVVYKLDGRQVWKTTGTAVYATAKTAEDTLLGKAAESRLHNKLSSLMGESPKPKESALPVRKSRLKLSDIISTASRYRSFSVDMLRAWNRFTAWLPKNLKYADQVTADQAFTYLNENYSKATGKTWNNNKTYLHNIFKCILIDAGLPESPFDRVIQRKNDTELHQRPFTEDECTAIIVAAKEPWRSACIIAYYTGLRQKDCFALCWNQIKKGIIELLPGKTARYNRAVQIPIHPQLARHLKALPHTSETVLGFVGKQSHKGRFTRYFGELLRELKIKDNEHGIVQFNCFRNTFVTRCRKYRIAEHAIRGVVGHVDEEMTDLYSHDIESAKAIKKLPAGKF